MGSGRFFRAKAVNFVGIQSVVCAWNILHDGENFALILLAELQNSIIFFSGASILFELCLFVFYF